MFATDLECRAHMIDHHSNLFLPDELQLIVELSQHTVVCPVSCPLCLHDHNLVHIDEDEHIATHLHAFSLLALPWDFDIEDLGASDGSSPKPPPSHPLTPEPREEEKEQDLVDFKAARDSTQSLIEGAMSSSESLGPKDFVAVTLPRLGEMLGMTSIWVELSENQRERCTALLSRICSNLRELSMEKAEDVEYIVEEITLDIELIEGYIQETARQDYDLWELASKAGTTGTRQYLQGRLLNKVTMHSDSLASQLEHLLYAAWTLQDKCNGLGREERQISDDIVASLQQVADDEHVFLWPVTDWPWTALSAEIEVSILISSASAFSSADSRYRQL